MALECSIVSTENLQGRTAYLIKVIQGERETVVRKHYTDFCILDQDDLVQRLPRDNRPTLPPKGCFGLRHKLNLFSFNHARKEGLQNYLNRLLQIPSAQAPLLRNFLSDAGESNAPAVQKAGPPASSSSADRWGSLQPLAEPEPEMPAEASSLRLAEGASKQSTSNQATQPEASSDKLAEGLPAETTASEFPPPPQNTLRENTLGLVKPLPVRPPVPALTSPGWALPSVGTWLMPPTPRLPSCCPEEEEGHSQEADQAAIGEVCNDDATAVSFAAPTVRRPQVSSPSSQVASPSPSPDADVHATPATEAANQNPPEDSPFAPASSVASSQEAQASFPADSLSEVATSSLREEDSTREEEAKEEGAGGGRGGRRKKNRKWKRTQRQGQTDVPVTGSGSSSCA